MIVFTQYDRLIRTKEDELQEDSDENIDPATLEYRSKEEARKAFEICVQSLQRTMNRLKIPMPRFVKVSGISCLGNIYLVLTAPKFVRATRKTFQLSWKSLGILSRNDSRKMLG